MRPENSRRLTWGILVVAAGLILLAHNLGWLHIDLWAFVGNFWPLLLVLAGLRLLIPNAAIYATIAVLMIAGAIWAEAYAPPQIRSHFDGSPNSYNQIITSQTLDQATAKDIDKLTFKLDLGAAGIDIHSTDDAAKFYQATFQNTGKIQEDLSQSNRQQTISLTEADTHGMFMGGSITGRRANIGLTPNLPLALEIDSGASTQKLDLSNLMLTSFRLDSGASSNDIKFGLKVSDLMATIDSGASSLRLHVPTDAGLRVETDSGLTSNNFEAAGLTKSGDDYQTDDFNSREHKIVIKLDTGATTITLDRY